MKLQVVDLVSFIKIIPAWPAKVDQLKLLGLILVILYCIAAPLWRHW